MGTKKSKSTLDAEIKRAIAGPPRAPARRLVVEFDVSGLGRDEIASLTYAVLAQAEGGEGYPEVTAKVKR